MIRKKYLLCLCFLFVWAGELMGQCAMCGATVQSKAEEEGFGNLAKALNTGIIYLMLTPYLAFIFIAWWWYKYLKKKNNQPNKPL